MTDQKSLINLGDLSKPATVLINRVSEAVGGFYRPYQIRRTAKAEAEADKIRALAKIEVSEIERRGLIRFVKEEAKKQENIENITTRAALQLDDNAKPDGLENDWITNFFEKCRVVSDQEMQVLWSKILAGEATMPGTFAKRTVDFVSNLDKSDAHMFTDLCTFVWKIGPLVPLVFNTNDEIYQKHKIDFSVIKHLDDIGLVAFNEVTNYYRHSLPKEIVVSYYGRPIGMIFPKEKDNTIGLGKVLLTQIGSELAPIAGSTRQMRFFSM